MILEIIRGNASSEYRVVCFSFKTNGGAAVPALGNNCRTVYIGTLKVSLKPVEKKMRKGHQMILISGTAEWSASHPGAVIGFLELSGVENTFPSIRLTQRKRETEDRLRKDFAGFSRQDFLALPVMSAYKQYYKHFNKTYHVQLQVESIVLKARNLPEVSPLVDANFAAETDTFVLTAGHDVAKLEEPVLIDISRTGDEITPMNGITKLIMTGDMVMRDKHGVCCSILYGQDNRSLITADTRRVLYVAYAPLGVPTEAIEAQLQKIEQNVRLFAPRASVEQNWLLVA